MGRSYAGIGSRRTPPNVLSQMSDIATELAAAGWTLRSGGAEGADTAFEVGCDIINGAKEIYLPWKGFNGNPSPLFTPASQTFEVAKSIHAAWNHLSPPTRNLMARNVHQVLGHNVDDPIHFVVCYTPDGCTSRERYTSKTGGTGLAIALASTLDIPVFNLKHPEAYRHLVEFINQRSIM